MGVYDDHVINNPDPHGACQTSMLIISSPTKETKSSQTHHFYAAETMVLSIQYIYAPNTSLTALNWPSYALTH